MTTKGLWILLFVAVQVSVGFCRSTETPIKNLKDIATVIHPADLPKILEVQNTKGVDINDTQHYPTGIPDIARVIHPADLPKILEVQNAKGVDINDTQHYPTGIPGRIPYGEYLYSYPRNNRNTTSFGIAAIIVSVFILLSFILGCICCCCYKKTPRRGFILNSAGGQTSMMQQPAPVSPASIQPMQQQQFHHGQIHLQNVYPPVHANR